MKTSKTKKQVSRLEDLLVEEVSIVDRPANQRRFLMVKNEEVGDEIVESDDGDLVSDVIDKAVWSTSMINDFPDSSFLYIKPGGKKDDSGKTVPRTNRMFPYKDGSGAIDLPHLRNAIARIPQSGLSQSLKDSLQAKAKQLLAGTNKSGAKKSEEPEMNDIVKAFTEAGERVEEISKRLTLDDEIRSAMMKSLYDAMTRIGSVIRMADYASPDNGKGDSKLAPLFATELAEVSKEIAALAKKVGAVTKSDDSDPTPAPESSETAVQLEALVKSMEAEVEKRGAKMSKGRLEQFRGALDALSKILVEIDSAGKEKGDDVAKSVEGLASQLSQVTDVIRKQAQQINALRQARQPSNAIPVEKGHRTTEVEETSWPMDMNDEKTPETVNKATSFY